MKSRITKTANGHKLQISYEDWVKVGKTAGWKMQKQAGKVQKSLIQGEKNKFTNQVFPLTNTPQERIPLQQIFNALNSIGVEAVQEDGTKWAGLLSGEDSHALIDLVRIQNRTPLNNRLFLSWEKYKLQPGYAINMYLT